MKKRIILFSLSVLISGIMLGKGVEVLQKTYTSTTYDKQLPILVDGILNDAAWLSVPWGDNFIQRMPYDGKNPTQKTAFKILFDEDYLYVAIKAYDTAPDSIVRRVSRRDNVDGDRVGLAIDSYFDKRTAFAFWVNAAGVKYDFILTNDGENEDPNWDPIWWAKTSVDKEGWNAEMKIPLNQLRFAQKEDLNWGLQVGRLLFRKEEASFWQHVPREVSGWVAYFGELKSQSNLKPKKQVEIAPYFVTKTERFNSIVGDPYMTGKRNGFNGGVDAKIGITNDFTLDLTVNPDFGQVEADPAVVNLTAFETYFPEKRPFFIEGRNLFDFRLMGGDGDQESENLFYSRRIGRSPQIYPDLADNEYAKVPDNTTILGAAKISGKNRNGLSVGVMESLTAKTYAEIDNLGLRKHEVVEPLTNYFVSSLRKDYNEGNTIIGGIITSTNRQLTPTTIGLLHNNAYSGGVDFVHQWANKKYLFNFRTYFSRVEGSKEAILNTQESSIRYFQRVDAKHVGIDSSRTSLTGSGGLIQAGKVGEGHFRYLGFVSWKSPQLEINDIGFTTNVDDIFQVFWVGYRYWEPISIFRNINLNFNQWTGWNFAGNSTYTGGNVNFYVQFKNYWGFGAGINRNGNKLSNSALRGGPMLALPGHWNIWYNIESDQRKLFTYVLGGSSNWGDNGFQKSNAFFGMISYKPSKNILLSLVPEIMFRNSELQFVTNTDWNGNARYINASIDQVSYDLSIRLEYSINPELTIQYFGRPFITSGKYSDYKRITNPRASAFEDRFTIIDPSQLTYNADNNEFAVDENGDNATDYFIPKNDFNFMDFQSNMIVRWEYRPGSTVFFVWTMGKNDYYSSYSNNIGNDVDNLFSSHPHNIFLIKFSYRFN